MKKHEEYVIIGHWHMSEESQLILQIAALSCSAICLYAVNVLILPASIYSGL